MYDEQKETDKFVRLVGGTKKADRLQDIWRNSCPHSTSDVFKPITREEDFRRQAKEEGFTDKQIEAFLKLR